MNIGLVYIIGISIPVIFTFYIYCKDKYDRMPIIDIVKTFVIGLIYFAVVFVLEKQMIKLFGGEDEILSSTSHCFINAFFIAALPEELFKLISLFIVAKIGNGMKGRIDGIVYAVIIGMSFAMFENIKYISDGIMIGASSVGRAFLAVPGHFVVSAIMGYFFSFFWFNRVDWKHATLMFLIPFLFHGIHNSYAFIIIRLLSLQVISGYQLIFCMIPIPVVLLLLFIFVIRKCINSHLRTDLNIYIKSHTSE